MDVTDKIAVVTGSAKGIGLALTKGLLEKGAKVCMCDINESLGDKECRELSRKYGDDHVVFAGCDVRDEDQFKKVFQITKEKFQGVDIVINNAGVVDEEHWNKCVDINLKGCIIGTRLGVEALRTGNGGRGGIVVNMSSVAGHIPFWFMPVYTATKHGVLGLSKSYAINQTVTSEGVRVRCLCPCVVNTDIVTEELKIIGADFLRDNPIMSTDVVVEALFKLLNDIDSDGCALKVNPGNPEEHLKYI